MNADEYIRFRLDAHRLPDGLDEATEREVAAPLKEYISAWAGCAATVGLTGARAKGTALDQSSDLDLLVVLEKNTEENAAALYDSLYRYMNGLGLKTMRKDAGVSVLYQNQIVDLIPAVQTAADGMLLLYSYKTGRDILTVPDAHVSYVRESGRLEDVLALKLWRDNHQAPLPSLYLERFVIRALQGRGKGLLTENFLYLLKLLWGSLDTMRVPDPANAENDLSLCITEAERKKTKDILYPYLGCKDFSADLLW